MLVTCFLQSMVVKQVSCYTISLTIEKLGESCMNVTLRLELHVHKLYVILLLNY